MTVASIAPFISQNNNAEALIVILLQLLDNCVLSLSLSLCELMTKSHCLHEVSLQAKQEIVLP